MAYKNFMKSRSMCISSFTNKAENKNLYIVQSHKYLDNIIYLNLEMPTPYSWYLGHISETPTANAIWLLNKRWDPLFFSSCYCSVIKHNLHHIMCLTLCLNCSRTFKTMIWLFQSTSQNVFWFSSKLDIAF